MNKIYNKIAITTCLSIITLNVNKCSIKRRRVTERRRKQDPYICCTQDTHFRSEDAQTENNWMDKDISCKRK